MNHCWLGTGQHETYWIMLDWLARSSWPDQAGLVTTLRSRELLFERPSDNSLLLMGLPGINACVR